jgi:hypothetical protein
MSDSDPITVVPLSPLDNLMVPCWVKILFYFSMPPETSIPSTFKLLQKALSLAVTEMPICGGTVQYRPQSRADWKPNQLEVSFPQNIGQDGAFPLDFEDLSDRFSFDEIRAAGFPIEEVDGKLLMKRSFNTDLQAGIEATAAQASFVKGGCLLGLAMWHNVVDAYGTYTFAQCWAKHCKALQSAPEWEKEWPQRLQTSDAVMTNSDREALTNMWRANEGDAELSDRQWRILGIYPPTATDAPRLDVLLSGILSGNQPAQKVRTGIFTITEEALTQLKQETASSENITTNDALHALLWRGIMRARYPKSSSEEPSDYQIALDGREKLGEGELVSYLGDTFFFATATLPLSTVLSSSTPLAELAQLIRATLDSITRKDLLSAFGAAHSLPSYANLPYSLAGLIGASMIVVTHQYISLPALDFGAALGTPLAERPPGDEWNELFRRTIIMPTATGAGVEVLIALFDDEMERLKVDEEFGRYVKFSSY